MKLSGSFDHHSIADAFAHPGIDPRQHVSYGLVEQGDDSNPSVEFDTEYGQVFVHVVLQPSGLSVRARVAASVAGAGEGEYVPFVPNDEVIVIVPNGDEKAGCVIVGRLNNTYDAFPRQVAGQDATTNTFAFRRLRTPYIVETSASYLIRSATSKAFFSIDQTGTITMSDGNHNAFHVGADFVGMAAGDNSVLAQLDLQDKQFVVEANGSKLVLDGHSSYLTTPGTLTIGTGGDQAWGHVTTAESLIAFLGAFMTVWSTALNALGAVPLTGTTLGATINPGTLVGLMNGAIAAAAAFPVAPYQGAISLALATPATAVTPSIGRPGFLV